jgi:ribosomal protein L11 methyltransferase
MLQITVDCRDAELEQVEQALLGCGAQSLTYRDAEDNPVLEPAPGETPLWPTVRVCGLFLADTDPVQVTRALGQRLGHQAPVTIEPLAEQDWARAWMMHFKPMRFGRRLWIYPSWRAAPDPGAVNIELDPGLAFGTGTHATTALCLEWLDTHTPWDLELVDYGCGSGVLTLAALKLGARHVWAVDIDPQALQATLSNAQRNRLAGDRLDIVPSDRAPTAPVDVVVANILSGTLVNLCPILTRLTRRGGTVVLSGILGQQIDEVIDAYRRYFRFAPPRIRLDWALLEGTRLP